MTIIDQKFGAEIFTKKGKTFKFDSAECMLAYLQNNNVEPENVAQFLVVDAAKPSNIINAKNATYLITDKLPSPMGGNLSAYANKTDAQAQSVKYDGDLYDWNSVLNIFKK
jgi:copper chaperone NosL